MCIPLGPLCETCQNEPARSLIHYPTPRFCSSACALEPLNHLLELLEDRQ